VFAKEGTGRFVVSKMCAVDAKTWNQPEGNVITTASPQASAKLSC
jgi:hypothetical protein